MPPKGSTKAQPKEQIKTPQKTKAGAKAAATATKTLTKQTPKTIEPKKEEAKSVTPKKAKTTASYTRLIRNEKATVPIDVTYLGDIAESKQVKANFTHTLKLEAGAPFTLVDTYVIPEGQEHEGHQLILLKPSQAFKFMKLPKEVRARIYKFLFFTKGQGSQPITLDGKRKNDSKDPFAKSFAEGSKDRVAILRINKEINEEATPILYGRPIRFDTPATLMSFFANLESRLRIHLRHIELRQYVKKDAKNALAFLAEAKGLDHLRIEVDVAKDNDVTKAAGAFWSDACKLLNAVGMRMEKTMVSPRKAKLEVVEAEDEGEASSEEDESEEEEDGGEDESEDNETEKTDESAKSGHAETENTVAQSTESKDAMDVKTEAAQFGDWKHADAEAEEGLTIDDLAKPADLGQTSDVKKKDSKSPVPVAIAKKRSTLEPPKLIQGEKYFAVDILNFGRAALKNKNGDLWDATKKKKFLDLLKSKLNAMHLSLWACVCGTYVNGHSCSTELKAKGKTAAEKLLRTEFEHLGHGGAEKIKETCNALR